MKISAVVAVLVQFVIYYHRDRRHARRPTDDLVVMSLGVRAVNIDPSPAAKICTTGTSQVGVEVKGDRVGGCVGGNSKRTKASSDGIQTTTTQSQVTAEEEGER